MNRNSFQKLLPTYLVFVLVVLAASVVFADSREVAKSINDELKGKVVLLRGMYAGSYLHFDSNGHVLGHADTGYWASDAMLEVKKVSVENDKLQISGKRLITVFDQKTGKFQNYRTDDKVVLEVDFDPTWHDPASQLRTVLSKMFAPNINEIANEAPKYWDCWLTGTIEPRGKGDWKCTPSDIPWDDLPGSGASKSQPASVLKKTSSGAEYYFARGGITPPKALKDDDPSYSPLARALKLQGTTILWVIVNERGVPSDIRVERPLGGGLDDRAVEAVRQWRFAPAMKDGRPVPVAINVEVNFRFE